VRQLAWYAARPITSNGKREHSRAEQINKMGGSVDDMPDAGCLSYLVEYLSDIGECSMSGGTMVANSWGELSSWAKLSGISLTPFEARHMRALSLAYVDQYYKSELIDCPPPHLKAVFVDVVEVKLKELFSMMRKSSG